MKYVKYLLAAVAVYFSATSCTLEKFRTDNSGISFTITGITGNNITSVKQLSAYRFADGILQESFISLTQGTDGRYVINPSERRGNMYFIANATFNYEKGTSLESFLSEKINDSMLKDGLNLMTARTGLQEQTEQSYVIKLKKSTASLIMDIQTSNTEINGISITGSKTEGMLWEEAGNGDTASEDRHFSYEKPLLEGKHFVCNLYEQSGTKAEIAISINTGNGNDIVRAYLPEKIERNKTYTLTVKGKGAAINASVSDSDWEDAENAESDKVKTGIIDTEASVFPAGVYANISADTLFVPYNDSEIILALKSMTDTEIETDGYAEGVTVEKKDYDTKSMYGYRKFLKISSGRKLIGVPEQYINVNMTDSEGRIISRVVLVFRPNPVKLSGEIKFDTSGTFDFNDYADGEFGILYMDEGYTASLEFDQGEKAWMKLSQSIEDRYAVRLLGGWRPNDPEADGRIQTAKLIIRNPEGEHETYTVKRRNYGLPVTRINGTWWCKYNARGTSWNFEDQILVHQDPAALSGTSVAEYLVNCTQEEFLDIWGYLYQGKSGKGLKVTVKDGIPQLEGYKYAQSDNIPVMEKNSLAPRGYELPATACYDSLMNSGMSVNRTDGPYTPKKQYSATKKSWVRSYYRSGISIEGTILPDLLHFEIYMKDNGTETGESITLYGPGDQWNDTGINANMQLFACHSPGTVREWMVKSGIMREHSGLANDTRVLRFIKTPVEYIY